MSFAQIHFSILACLLFVLTASGADKITYQDNVLPLIQANCAKCHNEDKKKADLDLTSYQGALKGSGSGAVLISGNPDASKLWKAITQTEDPTMPPNQPPLPEKDLEIFKKWIQDGLLETAGGKAVVAQRSEMDFTLKPDSASQPAGPPPMPKDLPIVAPIHTAGPPRSPDWPRARGRR